MVSFRKKYIQLGQGILPHEQTLLEQSIQAALTPMWPTERFVAELERDLLEEARRQERAGQGLRIAGWIGGGLLSIAGGILLWVLWQRHQTQPNDSKARMTSKRRPLFGTPKLAGVTPAT
ncbi:MAG: hypothetical protein WHX52_16740 [Anaerolineae bacterium]